METRSSQTDHSHIGKVVEWGYDLVDGNMIPKVTLWGCTKCDATSETSWPDSGYWEINEDHIEDGYCECFACKVHTLQLNAGDAKSAIINGGMTQKAWDKELDEYKKARAQGIQPKSTKMKDIKQAVDISNAVGKAYDAGSPTGGIL